MGTEQNRQDPKWIVLINKSPKGPLRADEIQALIAQGIVKRNDAAFLVGQEKTEWKFLWQFDEFDRRLQNDAGQPVPREPSVDTGEERRAAQKATIEALLPTEIASIEPEDLISKATPYVPEVTEVEFTENAGFKTGRTISLHFGVAVLFFGIVLYQIFKSDEKPKARAIANTPNVELPLNNTAAPSAPSRMPLDAGMPTSRPLERMERSAPRAVAPAQPPLPKGDMGEVPRREYERRLEDKRDRERYDDDDRDGDRDRAEVGEEDGDEEIMPKKAKKKRRLPTSADDEIESDSASDDIGGEAVEMDE